jgi:CSLREA domain-containing protein
MNFRVENCAPVKLRGRSFCIFLPPASYSQNPNSRLELFTFSQSTCLAQRFALVRISTFKRGNIMFQRIRTSLFVVALFFGCLTSPYIPIAHANASLVVNTTSDADNNADGVCSLREAITAANNNADYHECSSSNYGADTITFSVSGTITLGGFLPAIDDDVTIDGSANSVKITVSGANIFRVLYINANKTLNLNALTITNGSASGNGGGIENLGTLNITNSTIANNTAFGDGISGGGIHNLGTLNITNSTLFNNEVLAGGGDGAFGGGIANFGTLQIFNSTLSGNKATETTSGPQLGGGIYNYSIATLKNTIVAVNPVGGDCYTVVGTLTADPHNLDSDGTCDSATTSGQINLQTLADYGGTTPTMALASSSVAIDAGDKTVCADTNTVKGHDQRGKPRDDLQCDVGAFEFVYSDGHTVTKTFGVNDTAFTFGPTLTEISIPAGGPLMLDVNRELTTPSNNPPANALNIVWNISTSPLPPRPELRIPFTPMYSLDVTLCYDTNALSGQTESALHVFHYNGASWDDLGGALDTTTHAPYHCVTATGVSALSPFVLASGGPTAVDVTGLKGAVNAKGYVVLKWKTTTEARIAGFNIYRQTKTGEWKQLNASLKQAKHAGDALGDTYRYADKKVQAHKTYRYKIEIVCLDGHTEWTQIIKVKTP